MQKLVEKFLLDYFKMNGPKSNIEFMRDLFGLPIVDEQTPEGSAIALSHLYSMANVIFHMTPFYQAFKNLVKTKQLEHYVENGITKHRFLYSTHQ